MVLNTDKGGGGGGGGKHWFYLTNTLLFFNVISFLSMNLSQNKKLFSVIKQKQIGTIFSQQLLCFDTFMRKK